MDWHARYCLQAAWTRDLRDYLFGRAGLHSARRILEVGCGTGAILSGIPTTASIHGLDLDPQALAVCRLNVPSASLVRGDALCLPYACGSFDIVYCHFLLLWVHDPLRAVREMKRVVQAGGFVLALAEPDYAARVDKPAALAHLGRWQAEALRRRGADPGFGGRLGQVFFQSGLNLVESGQLKSRPPQALSQAEWESEWEVLESDLTGTISSGQLRNLKELDQKAWLKGERLLDVPTYFACATA